MLNERFIGVIKSCSAGAKTVKLEDGSRDKVGTVKLTIESNNIEYESMNKFNSNITSTLLNIQPMPFKLVDFGEMSGLYKLKLNEVEAGKVSIKNISVLVKENIPCYKLKLEFDSSCCTGRDILFSLKNKEVEFLLEERKYERYL